MIGIFVECTKTLGVQNKYIDGLALRSRPLDGAAPHPHALRARVDGWTHAEPAFLSVEQHSVQQIALARSVHPGHGHHANRGLQAQQVGSAFFIELENYKGNKIS